MFETADTGTGAATIASPAVGSNGKSRLTPEQKARLAARLSQAAQRTSLPEGSGMPQAVADLANRNQPFPLNLIQQAYMIGRESDIELGNTVCQAYDEVDIEDFDVTRFEGALAKMIERHDMLRSIVLSDGRQQILAQVPAYKIKVEDLRGYPSSKRDEHLAASRAEVRGTVRPANRWPLFDFKVSRMDERRSRLHMRIDLLIVDGRSFEILFGELFTLYQNPEAELPALKLSFRDYSTALQALEQTPQFQESRKYWEARLAALPPSPEFPLVKNPAAVEKQSFKRRSVRVDAETWKRLKERAAKFRATPSGVLLAAYAEVISIWSKNPRFTLNLTVFNRLPLDPQAADIIGDFTSVNLLAVDNSKPETFAQRAQRQKEQLWQDLAHRYFSGLHVMRELTRMQRVGPKAIMPVVFTSLLNLDDAGDETSGANRFGEPVYGITQTPQVYLDCMVEQDKGALIVNWDAVDELFPERMLDDMFRAFRHLLQDLADDDASWKRGFAENTSLLVPADQLEIRRQVNATEAPISDELLHTPFLRQVSSRPDQLAVCTPARRLTYAGLYQMACRVERELLDRDVKPNQMVGVLMAKGWEQIVAVLGIHFAGGAYLPIDSELPAERQKYLVENGGVKIVLTQSDLLQGLSLPEGVEALAVDTMERLPNVPPTPRRRQKPEDLAYIIYTSGSTGLPKGVMIDHRGAMNTVLDVNRRFAVGPKDRVLALSRLNFDLSVYDVFGLLAAGGAIVMPAAESAQDPSHWMELMIAEKVTLWNTVPALMQLATEEATNSGAKLSLRAVMMSGDWIPVNLPGQIQKLLPEAKIISMGGATEASIWSILYPIEKVDPNWKSVPYGKPMVNQTFHVLNHALAPCPAWVPGSLYIGGVGVAKGYNGDEKKTSASFITHPVTGDRIYRTGDLGRYLPDGNIEFLGREDFQVKIQGYRIELGEIEAKLQDYPGVDNCAVIVREDNPGEKRLAAYAVPLPGVQLDVAAIREQLRQKLPEYMVPSAYVVLDRFPLTANGKVDRKALPAPARPKMESSGTQRAAGDMLEMQLTQLWGKVLNVHPVGVTDNFFDLGGTSMMAVRLFSELRKRFGKSLSLATLFQAATVEKIAELVRSSGYASSWASIVPIQPGGHKPPFYCVHGAGGNVLMFRELAERMAPDFPFYGIQARGLDGSKNYLQTVEEMAAAYLKEVKQMQPEGPYYLGGFCLGGQIAFEMAKLLEKDGEKVALLGIIDTYNFQGERLDLSFTERLSSMRQQVSFHFVNLIKLGITEQARYLFRKAKGFYVRESERVAVRVRTALGIGPYGQNGADVELERLNEDAHFAYIATPYDGNTIVFKAKKNYSYLHDPMLGWKDVLTGPLDFIELPSNPGGLFMEPYVQVLAGKLKEKIEEAAALHDFEALAQGVGQEIRSK
jgi:pyochelin synthetase